MKFDNIIRDAAQMPASASERAVTISLSTKLNAAHAPDTITPKAISKWIARKSIPGKWLLRLAGLTHPPLDLATYA